jgi:hypothetical protein
MRPLVAIRRAVPFDPAFLDRDPLVSVLSRAAGSLGVLDDFPSVERLTRVFDGEPPVRFVPAQPRRRRRAPVDPRALYDARITLDREVPTRPRCWHDFMNALAWGTFPRAKRILHARQHAAIAARVEPGARLLPPTRSSELDALALLDEGGVVVLAGRPQELGPAPRVDREALRHALAQGRAEAVVFGHAVHESLVLGARPAILAAVVLPREEGAQSLAERADARLAAWLGTPGSASSPRELARVEVDDLRTGRGSA